MSQPPEVPGRRREKRAASSAAGDAYQGAFEAVMAVLVGAGFGYWVDARWNTTPIGVIAGVVVGFAAMVLRLLRLGRELVPEEMPVKEKASGPRSPETKTGSGAEAGFGTESDADRGPAETPALSDIWRDDATDERE